jgi:tRNA dimethylallyltransferase
MSESTSAGRPVICLMGPTASGKTDLALGLHGLGGIDIISVDSAMVYRGMDIGTAKPSAAVRARAPHALVDIRDPAQPYSAADFIIDAQACIAESHAAGRLPLLVGGTMLYFRALSQGLAPLPAADADLRARLEAQARRGGWPSMHRRLTEVDPDTAARLHPNDAQRIQRALEVHALTGQPISRLQRQPTAEPRPHRLVKVAVYPGDRGELHRRIEQRFEQMLAQGFVDEVDDLRSRADLHRDLPAMRSVGYRQVWDYLDGTIRSDELAYRGVVATRQFARRQLTWLRREEHLIWLDSADAAVHDQLRQQIDDVLP